MSCSLCHEPPRLVPLFWSSYYLALICLDCWARQIYRRR